MIYFYTAEFMNIPNVFILERKIPGLVKTLKLHYFSLLKFLQGKVRNFIELKMNGLPSIKERQKTKK